MRRVEGERAGGGGRLGGGLALQQLAQRLQPLEDLGQRAAAAAAREEGALREAEEQQGREQRAVRPRGEAAAARGRLRRGGQVAEQPPLPQRQPSALAAALAFVGGGRARVPQQAQVGHRERVALVRRPLALVVALVPLAELLQRLRRPWQSSLPRLRQLRPARPRHRGELRPPRSAPQQSEPRDRRARPLQPLLRFPCRRRRRARRRRTACPLRLHGLHRTAAGSGLATARLGGGGGATRGRRLGGGAARRGLGGLGSAARGRGGAAQARLQRGSPLQLAALRPQGGDGCLEALHVSSGLRI